MRESAQAFHTNIFHDDLVKVKTAWPQRNGTTGQQGYRKKAETELKPLINANGEHYGMLCLLRDPAVYNQPSHLLLKLSSLALCMSCPEVMKLVAAAAIGVVPSVV